MQKHQKRVAKNATPKSAQKVAPTRTRDMRGLGLNAEMQRHHTMIIQDVALLKLIKSHDQRDEQKALLIPKYDSYLKAYLAQDKRHKNPVLVQVMVWLFDTKQIDNALELAELAMEIKDDTPQGFTSSIHDWVLDTLHDYLNAEYEAGRGAEPYLSFAFEVMKGLDTFDQIKAKFHKLAAFYAYDLEDWKIAAPHFLEAERLNPKIQVTTKRKDAVKKLAKENEGGEQKADESQPVITGDDDSTQIEANPS